MLSIILLAKVFGDCVNPTIEECAAKTSKGSCNAAGSGCRYREANSGACGLPSTDSCAAKTQSSLCTGACLWSTDAACVRTSNPVCNRTFNSPGCSPGCVFTTEDVRCIGSYQYQAGTCAMLSMDPDNSQYCTKINGCYTFSGGYCTTNIFWGCKIEGSKCVAKTVNEYYSEECQNRGVGNNGDDCRLGRCKVKDGSCVPNTLQDRAARACEVACTDPMYCKSEGTNCVVKTNLEIYEYYCSTFTVANCVTSGRGGCKVVNNECVPNPNFDADVAYSPVCSLNSEGDACDEDSTNSYCETVRDKCVLQSCDVGVSTCSAGALAAGCSSIAAGSGYCGVNSALVTCVTATECSSELIQAGCANTPAVTSACLPKAELTCSGSDTCRPEELAAGCITRTDTDTATTVAVPMIVFVVLALFW